MSALISEYKTRKTHEAEQAHDQIRAAVAAGRVRIYADANALSYEGSPVHSPWDHLAPLLAFMVLALIVLLAAGLAAGLVAMTLAAVMHLTCGRYYVSWRLQRRVEAFILHSLAQWQTLWDLGGVAIALVAGHEAPCVAPAGDWRKFVRRNFPAEGPPPPPPAAEPADGE
jgi:hypothetical protein